MKPDEIKSNLKVSSNCVILEALEYINELEAEIESITEKFNRQQVEIERLEKHELSEAMKFNNDTINRVKSEAIKEFAEKVKLKFYEEFDELIPSIMADEIDNLVKEMESEDK